MPCRAMSLCHRLGTELSFSVFLQLLSQGSTGSLVQGWGDRVRSRVVVAGVSDLKQQ